MNKTCKNCLVLKYTPEKLATACLACEDFEKAFDEWSQEHGLDMEVLD